MSEQHGWHVRRAEPGDLAAAHALIWRVLAEDLGVRYNPVWHWDLDDLAGTYLERPHQALFVAVDTTQEVIGTTGVRAGGPKSPPHPAWLAERYAHQATAQLVRVYIDPAYRRQGVARALVDAARQFVAQDGSYDVLYLHTDVQVPGAELFWRAMPTAEVYDGRAQQPPEHTVHFELAFAPAPTREDARGRAAC